MVYLRPKVLKSGCNGAQGRRWSEQQQASRSEKREQAEIGQKSVKKCGSNPCGIQRKPINKGIATRLVEHR